MISRGSVNDPSSVCEARIGTLVVRLHLPLLFLNADQPFHWRRPPFYTLGPHRHNTSAPSLTPFDFAPAQTSCKRPRASQFTVNVPPYAQTLNDDHDDILNLKKAQTNGPRSDLYTSGRHSGVGITDIDDVADARDEFLNKTDPTVDIKAFFKTLPHVPGRPKSHMSCNLCA